MDGFGQILTYFLFLIALSIIYSYKYIKWWSLYTGCDKSWHDYLNILYEHICWTILLIRNIFVGIYWHIFRNVYSHGNEWSGTPYPRNQLYEGRGGGGGGGEGVKLEIFFKRRLFWAPFFFFFFSHTVSNFSTYATGLGFVIVNPCVSNRVDLGVFLFHKLANFIPPPLPITYPGVPSPRQPFRSCHCCERMGVRRENERYIRTTQVLFFEPLFCPNSPRVALVSKDSKYYSISRYNVVIFLFFLCMLERHTEICGRRVVRWINIIL